MRKLLKRISALAVVGGVVAAGFVGVAAPASAAEGSVRVVQSRSEAPEGTVWTAGTTDPLTCVVTDTGVHTQPGQHHEAETELRTPYKQVIPGQTELSHQEYKYSRTVADFKTQYFFAKFTHTKTRTWIKEVPAQAAVYEKFVWTGGGRYAPTTPPPSEGWKSAGTTSDVKASDADKIIRGNGNGNYFYFKTTKPAVPAVPGKWSDWSSYGPWTLWNPIQHTSWEDSNAPLGTPQAHGGGGNGDNFYREWQAQPTGETRQVQTGTHVETSDWLTAPPAGEGWTQIEERKVIDQHKTDDKTVYFLPGGEPTTTLTDANYTATNPGSPWVKAGEDKRFETKAAYTDPDVVTNYSHTHKDPDCTLPPLPANPNATATGVCDAVNVVLTNPIVKDANQMTASFVVLVDGKFYDAYAVEVGNREAFSIEGDHKVEVRTGPAFGYELLASAESKTDCVVPPTEEPPVVTPPVTETPKPTPAPSETPTPVAPATGDLAQTGANPVQIIGWSVLGFLVLAAGTTLFYAGRRKAQAIPVKAEEQE